MKIILAVSGGVDSVSMLHSLATSDGFADVEKADLIVAHFDHGIRNDSDADARFVEKLAEKYGLKFYLGKAKLGQYASEAEARKVRWDFLKKLQSEHNAIIATAHHKDDVLETQIINLLRGSERRGISVLKDSELVVRPLIKRTKKEIYEYTINHNLEFVEDNTNWDNSYLRNKVRNIYLPKIGEDLIRLENKLSEVQMLNVEIDDLLHELVESLVEIQDSEIRVKKINIAKLDSVVMKELMRECIDLIGVMHDKQKITRKTIELLAEFAARNDSNRMHDVTGNLKAKLIKDDFVLFAL